MGSYKEVTGDLIALAKAGDFDVIAHGCNCQVKMGAGIALQMATEFKADDTDRVFSDLLESGLDFSKYEKLGNIVWHKPFLLGAKCPEDLVVVNCYTQHWYGKNHPDGEEKPLNYTALRLCLDKMNHMFKGKRVGLPQIGCHLAGGDWDIVKMFIQKELKDCDVTVVIYKR